VLDEVRFRPGKHTILWPGARRERCWSGFRTAEPFPDPGCAGVL